MRVVRLVVPVLLVSFSLSIAPAQAASGDDPGGGGLLGTLLSRLTHTTAPVSTAPASTAPASTAPASTAPASDPPADNSGPSTGSGVAAPVTPPVAQPAALEPPSFLTPNTPSLLQKIQILQPKKIIPDETTPPEETTPETDPPPAKIRDINGYYDDGCQSYEGLYDSPSAAGYYDGCGGGCQSTDVTAEGYNPDGCYEGGCQSGDVTLEGYNPDGCYEGGCDYNSGASSAGYNSDGCYGGGCDYNSDVTYDNYGNSYDGCHNNGCKYHDGGYENGDGWMSGQNYGGYDGCNHHGHKKHHKKRHHDDGRCHDHGDHDWNKSKHDWNSDWNHDWSNGGNDWSDGGNDTNLPNDWSNQEWVPAEPGSDGPHVVKPLEDVSASHSDGGSGDWSNDDSWNGNNNWNEDGHKWRHHKNGDDDDCHDGDDPDHKKLPDTGAPSNMPIFVGGFLVIAGFSILRRVRA